MVITPSTDLSSSNASADEPPEVALGFAPHTHGKNPSDVVVSHALPITTHPTLPLHRAETPSTADSTAKLGISPGKTESLPGSPSSMSSVMSAASYRRGDADTEDEPETELEAVNEVDELDYHEHVLSTLDTSDKDVHDTRDGTSAPGTTQTATVEKGDDRKSMPAKPSPLCARHEPCTKDEEDAPVVSSMPVRRRSRRSHRSRKPLKSALSSSEDEKRGTSRGRKKHSVRFCDAPPEMNRTHSLVDYDRKALPVHNQLCQDDLRELRDMHMTIDLLQSRCQNLRVSDKTPAELPQYDVWHATAMQNTSPLKAPSAPTGPTSLYANECDSKTPERKLSCSPTPDPLADLQAVNEQKQYSMKHLPVPGTIGGCAQRGPPPSSTLASSIAARFGLDKPPPPLPGTPGRQVMASWSTSDLTTRASARSTAMQGTSQKRQSRSLSPQAVYDNSVGGDFAACGSEYDMMGV